MTVFIAGPTKVWKFRETDPKEYQVYARYYDQCVTCLKCVDVCPVECITVNTGADAPVNEDDDLDEEPDEQPIEQPAASE
jgi:formate hydrogenlyase subunit 6/NADH:ubiquinone oxidoreductase subunit I